MNDRQRTGEAQPTKSGAQVLGQESGLESARDGVREGEREPSSRLPYRAPTLKYLGSVRELTLGGTQGVRREGRFTTRR